MGSWLKRLLVAGTGTGIVVLGCGIWLYSGEDQPDQPYNYKQFTTAAVNETMGGDSFHIRAGEPFPAHHQVLNVRNGEYVALAEMWRDKPLVLETGSVTCPIFSGKGVTMDGLFEEYGDRATIALLYVREAHPGILRPAHKDMADKITVAGSLNLLRPVLVDKHGGELHRAIGVHPNMVYIIGTDGRVAHYSLWNNPEETRASLRRLLDAGGRTSDLPELFANLCPVPTIDSMPRSLLRLIRNSGPDALQDAFSIRKAWAGGQATFFLPVERCKEEHLMSRTSPAAGAH